MVVLDDRSARGNVTEGGPRDESQTSILRELDKGVELVEEISKLTILKRFIYRGKYRDLQAVWG